MRTSWLVNQPPRTWRVACALCVVATGCDYFGGSSWTDRDERAWHWVVDTAGPAVATDESDPTGAEVLRAWRSVDTSFVDLTLNEQWMTDNRLLADAAPPALLETARALDAWFAAGAKPSLPHSLDGALVAIEYSRLATGVLIVSEAAQRDRLRAVLAMAAILRKRGDMLSAVVGISIVRTAIEWVDARGADPSWLADGLPKPEEAVPIIAREMISTITMANDELGGSNLARSQVDDARRAFARRLKRLAERPTDFEWLEGHADMREVAANGPLVRLLAADYSVLIRPLREVLEEHRRVLRYGARGPLPEAADGPGSATSSRTARFVPTGIRRSAPFTYQVPAKVADRALSDPSSVAADMRIVPSFGEGTPRGFKVFAIKDASLWQQLGLRDGDILLRANDIDMTSPSRALDIFASIKKVRRADIEMMRGEETITLRWRVVP